MTARVQLRKEICGRGSQGVGAKTNWLAVNRQSWSNSDSDSDLLVESAENWSCEKLKSDNWYLSQFGNAEEGEYPLFEAATKQRLMKTE
jgi:hypothetical protein